MSNDFDSQDPIKEPFPQQSYDDLNAPAAKKGMSRNTKIILGIVGGLLALCCIAAIVVAIFVQRAGEQFAEGFDNPEAAAETAAEIVTYDLPPGFAEEGAMSFFGIDTVFISSDTNDSVIMFMAFPEMFAGNEAEMQQQMEDAMAENIGQEGISMQFVESRNVVINDSNTTVNIFEGTDENGTLVRQATAIFESNSGKPSMLMVFAPANRWESADLDGFIESLR